MRAVTAWFYYQAVIINRRYAEFAETRKLPLISIRQPEKPGKLNPGLIAALRPSSSVRSATLRFIARKFQGLNIQLRLLTTPHYQHLKATA